VWWLTRESGTLCVHNGCRKDIASAARRAYLVLVMSGRRLQETWCSGVLALLSKDTLEVVLCRVLPWLAETRLLEWEELQQHVDPVIARMSDRYAYSRAEDAWCSAVRCVVSSVNVGSFAQGRMCRCSIGSVCAGCLDVGLLRCVFVTGNLELYSWVSALPDGVDAKKVFGQ
jgi:hypothetical protein